MACAHADMPPPDVQYQMCIIIQLPHVLPLTGIQWQGAPTSLRKCVFQDVGEQTFATLCSNVGYAEQSYQPLRLIQGRLTVQSHRP